MQKKHLFYLGNVEAISLLVLLFICSPLKWFLGIPEPVRVMGSLHGFLFLIYVVAVLSMDPEDGFTVRAKILGLIASALPFGPFWFHRRMNKKGVGGF